MSADRLPLVEPAVSRGAMRSLKRPQLPALTGVRFLAAILVALTHGTLAIARFREAPEYIAYIAELSGLGMNLFFVLSGFVIHYNYLESVNTTPGFSAFIASRIARLYPLYIVLLSSELLLFELTAHAGVFGHDSRALPFYFTLTQSWTYLVLNDASLIYQFGEIAQISWSISTEAWFYLCYPLLAAALTRVRRPAATITLLVAWCGVTTILLVSIAAQSEEISRTMGMAFGELADGRTSITPQDSFMRWLLYLSPYTRIFQFVLGVLVAQLFVQQAAVPLGPVERRIGAVLSIVAIVGMYLAHRLTYFLRADLSLVMLPAGACGLLIYCCARYSNAVTAVFRRTWIVMAGDASYSIYLLHLPVFSLFRGSPTDPSLFNQIQSLVLLWIVLAGIVLLSVASYRFFEVPARDWIRNGMKVPGVGMLFGYRARTVAAWTIAAVAFAAPLGSIGFLGLSAWSAVGPLAHGGLQPASDGTIDVLSATYGANCVNIRDNALPSVRQHCQGRASCDYSVGVATLGDPAGGCPKDFRVVWRCVGSPGTQALELPAEAGFRSLARLGCGR